MVKIKCIDKHSPPMEKEVSEEEAKELIATEKWEKVYKRKPKKVKEIENGTI
jgi:hypothetical protein